MAGNFLTKVIAAGIGFSALVASQSVLAASDYKMNAMCYLVDGKNNQTQAFNPTAQEIKESGSSYVKEVPTEVTAQDVQTKFRIASLSKVLTTHWAVATLGPEYRFKTKIHITPANVKTKTCYVHIEGDNDIFLGKEMLSTAFQQLKPILSKANCNTISQLSYDENLIIPFYKDTSAFIIEHRNLPKFRGSDPDLFYGPVTTQRALSHFVKKFSPIKVDEIKPSLSSEYAQYAKTVPVKTFSFKSRPLYMMMREFNAYSSNVPPNILFEKLGGRDAYNRFIKIRLGLDTSSVDMYNGSGYPVRTNSESIYNEVSCASIVKIIQDLDHMLKAYKGSKDFQLADVMAVGGTEEPVSTFKGLYGASQYTNTLTAKTGSANKAITFGGMLSTTDGPLYFAVLTAPDAYRNLSNPRTYIRDLVNILADRKELKKFDYTQVGAMNPTDKEATLIEETAAISTKLN